jgi:hypothetical protein
VPGLVALSRNNDNLFWEPDSKRIGHHLLSVSHRLLLIVGGHSCRRTPSIGCPSPFRFRLGESRARGHSLGLHRSGATPARRHVTALVLLSLAPGARSGGQRQSPALGLDLGSARWISRQWCGRAGQRSRINDPACLIVATRWVRAKCLGRIVEAAMQQHCSLVIAFACLFGSAVDQTKCLKF